ncbi:hypothetical protein JI739_00350 [Ramlibacter sp. AW1]|uniref:Hemerythrin-like domain-containing protein n=1 Tax=Ramlibacter aurantiacus TaxID=2801330 RepID=A0A936ZEG1_9BURK|nr:hemerythrin domain-containing protein [Ramlibacter aurantiacus]MBL0418783.1 hypothetical protein [Ramlibacter aurantiacus]
MNATTPSPATLAATRVDLYAGVHKALRLCMSDTLIRVGAADPLDDGEVAEACQAVQDLLSLCESHLHKEDSFVHPLLDAALPGSAARAADDHRHHEADFADIAAMVDAVTAAAAPERAGALARLYRALSTFVGENLVHMTHEETAHNAALWDFYSDDELRSVEQRLVASIPPATMMGFLRWFIPALSIGERVQMLSGIRASAPPPVFEAVIGIARERLSARDFEQLSGRLGLAPQLTPSVAPA